MGAIPCPSCKERMNDAVAVCPHCGKRRPDAEVGLAKAKLSPEEVRAMLAVDASGDPPSQGLLPTLLFPHDRTQGGARIAEMVLTVLCLPMILAGAAFLSVQRRRSRRNWDDTSGEATPIIAMSVMGGMSLGSLLVYVTSITATLVIVGLEIAGLIVRGAIRSRASDSRSRTLHRIDPPPREPRHTGDDPSLLG